MNLIGLIPARNEEWVLGFSARVALSWCDSILIYNHASTDGTSGIIGALCAEFGSRVGVICDERSSWDEMDQRQQMLTWARANASETGATHIAIIDADEILTANLLPSIRQSISSLSLGEMLSLPGYNLRGGLRRYHLNGVWGQRNFSLAFKDVDTARWKGDKHHCREPEGVAWKRRNAVAQGNGGVLHLWGSSPRRLRAKHALYKISDTLRYPDTDRAKLDREYSWAIFGDPSMPSFGTPRTWTYAEIPASWTASYADLIIRYLRVDAEPWQEAEVRRLVAEHGCERFRGLDLFGIA